MHLQLIEKYRKDCISLIDPMTIIEIKQMVGNETDPIHMLWMLDQIENDNKQSETKKHRWLGYIQGVLTCKKVFTVTEEREYTRSIFNGE